MSPTSWCRKCSRPRSRIHRHQVLADVSDKLVQEVQRLAAVREAVAIERREIEQLHRIDVAATSLDQLIQDYQREKERLDSEIAAQRVAWEEESRATERERKETEDQLRKLRQRESEDYEYKKNQERKKAQDKYDEDQRLLEKRNKEKQEELERGWKQREEALKGQDDELNQLRQESAGAAARIKAEAERAAKEATHAAELGFEQQIVLMKKDAEAEKRVSELLVKNLEEAIARQSAQTASLEKQLAEAKQQVQEIAVRAIEGASGARALGHINQIAMEQAKNRPQG
jgi:colicin import membrane protein